MTALFACGVSLSRVLRPVLVLGVIIAVFVAGLSLFIRPWAYHQFFRLKKQAKVSFDLTRMTGGKFYALENGHRVIYADRVDPQGNRAQRVFIQTSRDDKLQVIFAQHARQIQEDVTGKQFLVFNDGLLYEFSRSGADGRIVQFDQSAMPLELPAAFKLKTRINAVATAKLLRSASLEETAELQWRLSTPMATILLALLAVPLSRSSPRRGKYAKVTTAVLIFAAYYNLIAIAKKGLENGLLAPAPGLWWVHIALAALVTALLWQPAILIRWLNKIKFRGYAYTRQNI
jgi:lipopolysaccharide export system permease protein